MSGRGHGEQATSSGQEPIQNLSGKPHLGAFNNSLATVADNKENRYLHPQPACYSVEPNYRQQPSLSSYGHESAAGASMGPKRSTKDLLRNLQQIAASQGQSVPSSFASSKHAPQNVFKSH